MIKFQSSNYVVVVIVAYEVNTSIVYYVYLNTVLMLCVRRGYMRVKACEWKHYYS